MVDLLYTNPKLMEVVEFELYGLGDAGK